MPGCTTRSVEPCASTEQTCEVCGSRVFEREFVTSCRRASFLTGRSKRTCYWGGPLQRSRSFVPPSKLPISKNCFSDFPRVGTHRWGQEGMLYRVASDNVLLWHGQCCNTRRCSCSMNRRRPWTLLPNAGSLRAWHAISQIKP